MAKAKVKSKSKVKKVALKKKTVSKKTTAKKTSGLSRAKIKKVAKKAAQTLHNIEGEALKLVSKIKDMAHHMVESKHPLLGKAVPDLHLKNQKNEDVNLSSIANSGKKVVLYFYPKDDTPGCTKEACNFRDSMNRIKSSDAIILGASPDKPESHKKFIEKYSLNFDLLSDADHRLCEAFGVWKEKSFMGRKYMGVERSAFLIHNGIIEKVWQPVKVEGHADEVLSVLGAL